MRPLNKTALMLGIVSFWGSTAATAQIRELHLCCTNEPPAIAISDDGLMVISRMQRWTVQTGWVYFGGTWNLNEPAPTAKSMSADGAIVVGSISVARQTTTHGVQNFHSPFASIDGGSPIELGAELPTSIGEGLLVSGDGLTIVGTLGSHQGLPNPQLGGRGFVRRGGVISLLTGPSGERFCIPTAISHDGATIAAICDDGDGVRRAAVFSGTGVVYLEGLPPGTGTPEILLLDNSGTTFVASSSDANFTRIRRGTTLVASSGLRPVAISLAGRRVVGTINNTGAKLWTRASGVLDLAAVATNVLGSANGWQFVDVADITSDGQSILLYGRRTVSDAGTTQEQYMSLPTPCSLADVAALGGMPIADGHLTAEDVVVFLNEYFSGNDDLADVAQLGGVSGRDEQLTPDDIVAFLATFFAACP